jgi:hypothetical protein
MTTTPNGLTLRDHFAAMAMQGLLAGRTLADGTTYGLSRRAYELADAMLDARTAPAPPAEVSKSDTARPS